MNELEFKQYEEEFKKVMSRLEVAEQAIGYQQTLIWGLVGIVGAIPSGGTSMLAAGVAGGVGGYVTENASSINPVPPPDFSDIERFLISGNK